jgi:hypothetical protein
MPFILDKEKEISEEVLSDFEAVLKEIFAEIINPEIPFTHKLSGEHCKFCE